MLFIHLKTHAIGMKIATRRISQLVTCWLPYTQQMALEIYKVRAPFIVYHTKIAVLNTKTLAGINIKSKNDKLNIKTISMKSTKVQSPQRISYSILAYSHCKLVTVSRAARTQEGPVG